MEQATTVLASTRQELATIAAPQAAKAESSLPDPFGAIDEVLLKQTTALQDARPMDEFLSRLTADLFQPCTAPGVPGSVPKLVRRSLGSLGWNVAQNRANEGARLPSMEQVKTVLASTRQELATIAAPQAAKAESSPSATGGGGGGSSLRATAQSFSFTASAPPFTPGGATATSTATDANSSGNGNTNARSQRICRFGSKCTRADCHFAHPERDGQPTSSATAFTEADPVLAELAAELEALDALQGEDDSEIPEEDFEAFLAMSGQATGSPAYDEDDEFERAQAEWLASQGVDE
jgi:hypothetical protein